MALLNLSEKRRITRLSGELETAIMEVLWDKGPLSGRDLHGEISRRKGIAYTTARTVLDRLAEKGFVKKDRASGMITFAPRVSRESYRSAMAEDLVGRAFEASPDLAVSAFAGHFAKMSGQDLDRLERLIKEKKNGKRKRREVTMKIARLFVLLALPALLGAQDNALRLDDLMRQALERNPKIKAAGLEAQAFSLRIPQEKSLPDPMVNFDLKNMGFPDFTLGQEVMSGVGVSFSQALPYPGKLRLKGEIAAKVYERQQETRNAVVQSVIKDVKAAYFELFLLHRSIAVLREQRTLLEKAQELTQTKYAVGNGIQADVLKAQVEISRMDEMITPMAEMIKSLEARINLLLDLPAERPLGVPQDPGVESLPLSLEAAKTSAAENSPMIKEASLMVEEGDKMVSLARKELRPNFVVGGGWEFKGRLPSMYEVMVGFEIPLYRKTKQSKMLEESVARLEGSKSSLASTTNDLVFMVTEDFLKAKAAESLIRLYKDKIIPQASLTVESSMASFQVSKTDFLALLADINTYYSYQIALYRELDELWNSIARLEEYTAKAIVNWGGNDEDSH